jgi:hypothetical protein
MVALRWSTFVICSCGHSALYHLTQDDSIAVRAASGEASRYGCQGYSYQPAPHDGPIIHRRRHDDTKRLPRVIAAPCHCLLHRAQVRRLAAVTPYEP